jgi:hypothetical protein
LFFSEDNQPNIQHTSPSISLEEASQSLVFISYFPPQKEIAYQMGDHLPCELSSMIRDSFVRALTFAPDAADAERSARFLSLPFYT